MSVMAEDFKVNFRILISETLHLPAKFNLNILIAAIFMYDSVVSVHKSLIPKFISKNECSP